MTPSGVPAPEPGPDLAATLRLARARAGLSLAQLEKRSWCSKSSLDRYLRGQTFPARSVAAAISDACGGDTPAVLATWDKEYLRRTSSGQSVAREPAPAAVADELPAEAAGFVGRRAVIARLRVALTAPGRNDAAVVVVSGPSGIGKSALAARVARGLRRHFPDGQLWVHAGGALAEPTVALGQLLRSLGVAAVPDQPLERVALYRTLTAGRRILVVLDDVSGAGRLDALVPSGPASAVLATSRVPVPGSMVVDLGGLARPEAAELAAGVAGAAWAAAGPRARRRVLDSCGGAPLALRAAAAGLIPPRAGEPHAGQPAGGNETGGNEAGGEPDRALIVELAVTAGVDIAIKRLSVAAREVLDGLARYTSGPVPEWTIGALAGAPADAPALLAELRAMSFLVPATDQRYELHDAVRARAALPAGTADPAVAGRLLDGWIAVAADRQRALGGRFFPPRDPPPPAPPAAAYRGGHPVDWFDRHRASLLDAVAMAARAGIPDRGSRLATLLTPYFSLRSDWSGWRDTHDAVLASGPDPYLVRGLAELAVYTSRLEEAGRLLARARRTLAAAGDTASDGYLLVLLGVVARKRGQLRPAARYTRLALARFEEAGDRHGIAEVRLRLAVQAVHSYDWVRADRHLAACLREAEELGDAHLAGYAHYWQGVSCRMRGDVDGGIPVLRTAERVLRELGDRRIAALCWCEQADLLRADDRPDEAAALLVHALSTMRELGHRSGETVAMHSLGRLVADTDPAAGVAVLRGALRTAEELGLAFAAERVRTTIDEVERRSA